MQFRGFDFYMPTYEIQQMWNKEVDVADDTLILDVTFHKTYDKESLYFG